MTSTFVGRPCRRHGDTARRYVSTDECVACSSECYHRRASIFGRSRRSEFTRRCQDYAYADPMSARDAIRLVS
jgi:hypothetical protein